MPRKKLLSKKEVNKNISSYLSMREMWVGLFIVALALIIGGRAVSKFISNGKNEARNVITVNNPKLTPELIPAISTVSGELAPTSTPRVQKIEPTPENNRIFITAIYGDSFWTISQRVCGTGDYNRSIEKYNGYKKHRKLLAGDTIEVICWYY